MKDTWRQAFRRLAVGCVVCGSMAWASAVSYAVQLAYDDATNPAYQNDDLNGSNDGNAANNTNGWQAGDNGGSGFTPWNFDAGIYWNYTYYAYTHPGFHEIDDGLKAGTHFSNPFNNVGKAWAMGSPVGSDGAPRYGRGFPALQTGQTFSVVLDNPSRRQFYKGYFIQLNGGTGGVNGSICNAQFGTKPCSPGGTPKAKLNMWRFEYFNYGQWQLSDSVDGAYIPLTDIQTAAAGMKLDVTMTGANTYEMSVTLGPGTPGESVAHTQSGTLLNPAFPIDWFNITFFNPTTDSGTPPATATDFYIRSMQITGPGVAGVPGDYNGDGVVDAADYVLWRKGGPLQNEVDTPGTVNAADYTAWRARFGNPPGSGSGLSGASVPEPGTFVYIVAAIGLSAVNLSRKRS